jgi:hypothetical protein
MLSRLGVTGGQRIHRQVIVRFGPLVVVTERPGVAEHLLVQDPRSRGVIIDAQEHAEMRQPVPQDEGIVGTSRRGQRLLELGAGRAAFRVGTRHGPQHERESPARRFLQPRGGRQHLIEQHAG